MPKSKLHPYVHENNQRMLEEGSLTFENKVKDRCREIEQAAFIRFRGVLQTPAESRRARKRRGR